MKKCLFVHVHAHTYRQTLAYVYIRSICLMASNSGRTAEPRGAAELPPGALKKASWFRV